MIIQCVCQNQNDLKTDDITQLEGGVFASIATKMAVRVLLDPLLTFMCAFASLSLANGSHCLTDCCGFGE